LPLALAFVALATIAPAGRSGAAPGDPPPPPPQSDVVASFTFDPKSPASGDTVTFRSTSGAWGADNEIVSYEWDLDGNGSFETSGPALVTRSYPSRRSIEVGLRVTDASQPPHTDVATRRISIANRAPVASFRWSPTVPRANEPVAFSSTATDQDGNVVEQAWDLDGNGKFDNGGGATAIRSFSAPGTYPVGLRVVDNDGSSSVIFLPIAIAPGPSTAVPTIVNQKSGLRLMNPFPIVRIAGRFTPGGARIKLLVVDAPKGAKVSIRCRGGGCPFKKQVRPAALVRVKKLERVLRAGATVKVYVTKRGLIGKYTQLKIRAGKPPARRDLCVPPGSWRPIRCPGL
jgi:PKD repeat protein